MIIQNEEKLRCIKRELGMRRRNYPRWVEQGKISKQAADREIEVMKAIEQDYERAVAREGLFSR